MVEYFNAAMGLDYTWKDLRRCGTRIYTVERAMQARYGLGRKDDYPPARYFEEPVPTGPQKGAVLDKAKYDKLLTAYYEHRGWTEDGIPKEATLKELGLQDVAEDLKKRKVYEAKKKTARQDAHGQD
jgi:aldehyde:ferredoxin oxidoreductase